MLTSKGIAGQLFPPAAHAVKLLSPTRMLAVVAYRVRTSIFAAIAAVERLFADFADVPYEDPANRRQWEELLESSAKRRPY